MKLLLFFFGWEIKSSKKLKKKNTCLFIVFIVLILKTKLKNLKIH